MNVKLSAEIKAETRSHPEMPHGVYWTVYFGDQAIDSGEDWFHSLDAAEQHGYVLSKELVPKWDGRIKTILSVLTDAYSIEVRED